MREFYEARSGKQRRCRRRNKLGIVRPMRVNAQPKVLAPLGAPIGRPGRRAMGLRQSAVAACADDHFEVAVVVRAEAQNRIRRNQDSARQHSENKHAGDGVSNSPTHRHRVYRESHARSIIIIGCPQRRLSLGVATPEPRSIPWSGGNSLLADAQFCFRPGLAVG